MAVVKVLLSCNNTDKKLDVPKNWTYKQFRNKVHEAFPQLPKDFSISDSDFTELTEDGFQEIQQNRLETWCLVRATNKDTCTLDKPRYELLRYDVHPNALTQSGNYHFSSSYQAFCEFVDNSIQATAKNHEKDIPRTIELHLFLKEKLAAIFDNGEGMTYEGLKAFATYFLSQTDRGLEKSQVDQIPAFLDSYISKFGVGATQAGFYLGDSIKVITKRDDCPYVTEITISKEKLHQRASEGKPVFEDYRCIRNPGDMSTVETTEEEKCLKDLIKQECNYEQFTCVVITGLKDIHIEYMKKDMGHHLTRSLAHVYHFYLWGEQGCSGNMRLPSPSRLSMELGNTTFQKANIKVVMDEGRNSSQRKTLDLCDVTDDPETRYQTRSKEWFPFSLTLKVAGLALPQTVQGVLMYYPHEAGQETIPRETDDEEDAEPIFECFWQGRLAPLSYVHRLEFCSTTSQRTKKQKDILPDICYRRLKGILFFNRHTPISNNKLKILLDERKDLSSALEDATAERRLPQEFRSWLEKCHKELDKEVSFDDLLPNQPRGGTGDVFYKSVRVITSNGEQSFSQGDIVKLDTKPIIYGRVLYFVQASKKNDFDKVVVVRQPDEVYQNQQEEKPLSRIIDIPDDKTLKRVFNAEKQMLPKTVRIFKNLPSEDLSSKVTWLAGESCKETSGFWIKVFSGERPPKPLVTVHNKKISVKQIVEGPEKVAPIQNDVPIDGERYGFKPFWLGKVGSYELKYVAILNDREMCSAKVDIEVKANVATFVRLDEPSEKETPTLALGEPSLKFKLHFQDEWANPTSLFRTGDNVKLEITSNHLEIRGVKSTYQANRNGDAEVKGLTLIPKGNGRGSFSRDHSIRVNAVDIGYVIFPIRVLTGPPHSIKLPAFETIEVQNYDEFPEFTVQVLDVWGQPCASPDRKRKLHAECDAFSGGPYLSSVEQGQCSFGPIKIKVASDQSPCTKKVKISLVTVDCVRRKQVISETVKELNHFTIKVLPSGLPHRIQICHGSQETNGVVTNGTARDTRRECLELSAPAGTLIKGLYLKAFDESGVCLTVNELRKSSPIITTSWNGEVLCRNLPSLPDCGVAQLVRNTFVGNVSCTCKEVTCQTQIRIRPLEGDPQKWFFSCNSNTIDIECDAKKQLPSKLTIQVQDNFGNPVECPPEITPVITLEHSSKENTKPVRYNGDMVYNVNNKEFVFSNDANISGSPGFLTMTVSDKDGKLVKDTKKINLKPGSPHHIELWSQSFDCSEQSQSHTLKAFPDCCPAHPIQACVCDRSGNRTPLKTKLNLSWKPASSGSMVTKKTRDKGDTSFTANVLRCFAKPDQDVKFKVSSSDHRTLQAAEVSVTVVPSNRVTDLIVRSDSNSLPVTSNYPPLKVECQTEDGVRVDAVGHLSLTLNDPNGNVISGTTVYRKPSQNREGVVTFLPLASKYLECSGNWTVSCQFTEYRDRLKSILLPAKHVTYKEEAFKFIALPGPPHSLSVKFPSEHAGILSASSTTDARGRTILPRSGKNETVEISSLDVHGNIANVSTTIDVGICWASGNLPDDVIPPELENHPIRITLDQGKARVPRLTLKSRVGNYIGEYLLVFTANGMEASKLRFFFSTDEHIQRIQTELAPLKKKIQDCEIEVHNAKKRLSKVRLEVNSKLTPIRDMFRGEPRSCEVKASMQEAKEKLVRIKDCERNVRPPCVQDGFPPNRIRQYIKGVVAELAYVSDPDLSRLLSWYLQPKMGVCLTTAIDKQRKVYDLGYPAYCESTLLPFSKKDFDGRDGKALPLEFPRPPPNFKSSIQFAINLLEFSADNGYLRSTFYWSLLSKTIVIEDLQSAQIYRQHLVQMRHPCPTILTRDGHVIASDGLMDPKRRCPKNLRELRFSFGSLPPSEQTVNRELQDTVTRLEDLNQTVVEYEKTMELVKMKEDQLKQQKSFLSPQITTLERELRKLRPAPSVSDSTESPDKRKRR